MMASGICFKLPLSLPPQPDYATAARYFGARGGADEKTLALLRAQAAPLLAQAAPRAVWLRCGVDAAARAGLLGPYAENALPFCAEPMRSGDAEKMCGEAPVSGTSSACGKALLPGLQSRDIARHLAGCGEVILLAVTLGPGVDAAIRRANLGDIAAGVAADALASALAEQMCDEAENTLRTLCEAGGEYLTGRFSPGYGDYPLAVQPGLAAALDTKKHIGLAVTPALLMTPRKSVTAVLGVGKMPVSGRRAGCGSCALRQKCEYRKRGQSCDENRAFQE